MSRTQGATLANSKRATEDDDRRRFATGLERDVVVARGRGPAHRGRGEVVRVGRHVALRGEPAAVLTAVLAALARAEELDRVGDDLHRLAVVAFLVGELAPLEAAVDRDRAALREVV